MAEVGQPRPFGCTCRMTALALYADLPSPLPKLSEVPNLGITPVGVQTFNQPNAAFGNPRSAPGHCRFQCDRAHILAGRPLLFCFSVGPLDPQPGATSMGRSTVPTR
jgi:hypothetical protein